MGALYGISSLRSAARRLECRIYPGPEWCLPLLGEGIERAMEESPGVLVMFSLLTWVVQWRKGCLFIQKFTNGPVLYAYSSCIVSP